MNTSNQSERVIRFIKKVSEKNLNEVKNSISRLREREDYLPQFDYFLDLIEQGNSPEAVARKVQKPLLALLCLQVPLELIHAAGFHAYKIVSGSQAAGTLAMQGLPALMCPMIRSVLGSLQLNCHDEFHAWVLPTTCDWVVKFPEMYKLLSGKNKMPVHWLDLPHLKDRDGSQQRWLDQVFEFEHFLEELSGRKLNRVQLMQSISIYEQAWKGLSRLTLMRRKGQITAQWYALITNTFFLDKIENWISAVNLLFPLLEKNETQCKGRVFLAGSPIFFPNFKILDLLEEAGFSVVGDDLCSSERLFPGAVHYHDSSEYGLMTALAQRYHQGCLCPTFADNDRRINNILGNLPSANFDGVIFHVLKGCHPYDLESYTIETSLKERGLKFMRLETDYSVEDSQNLLTRLEAFRHNLEKK